MRLKRKGLHTLPDTVYDILEFNPITKRLAMLWVDGEGNVIGIATESKDDIEIGISFPCKKIVKEKLKIYSFTEAMRKLADADEELLPVLSMQENDFNQLSLVGQYLLENKKQFITKKVIKGFHADFKKSIAEFEKGLSEDKKSHCFKSYFMSKVYSLMHHDNDIFEEEEEQTYPTRKPFVIEETTPFLKKENENSEIYTIFKTAFDNINFVLSRKTDKNQIDFLQNIKEEKLMHFNRMSTLYCKAVSNIENCFKMLETSGIFPDRVKQKCIDRMISEVHNYVLYLASQETEI